MCSEIYLNRDKRVNILGVGVDPVGLNSAARIIMSMQSHGKNGYVCVTGVHGVIESQGNERLRRIHNNSCLTVPDGMPLVWTGRLRGYKDMHRTYGPDLMREICRKSIRNTEKQDENSKIFTHFLFGSDTETLKQLTCALKKKYPGIKIVGSYSPPLWTDLTKPPLTQKQEAELRNMLEPDPPDFFWVGLSTPKQERFMDMYSGSSPKSKEGILPLPCGIMLGVGAAFDILSGKTKDAPRWMQKSGLQWFYRLTHETGRLWKRYLRIVPAFIFLITMQSLGIKKYSYEN